MARRPDEEPTERELPAGVGALEGPAEHELEYTGPGDARDERLAPDASLPGGVDHTTAAVGAGGIGLVLLGIAGVFTRWSNHRRYRSLDE